MTFADLLELPLKVLAKMTDDELRAVLTPYIASARPTEETKRKASEGSHAVSKASLGNASSSKPKASGKMSTRKALELLDMFGDDDSFQPKIKKN